MGAGHGAERSKKPRWQHACQDPSLRLRFVQEVVGKGAVSRLSPWDRKKLSPGNSGDQWSLKGPADRPMRLAEGAES